jgi:hypothetical protein
MKITIEVSERNEATAHPWWLILDPRQNMGADVDALAGQITGPFFSRQEAEDALLARRHHYSRRAVVYCHSGSNTIQYRQAIDAVGRMGDPPAPAAASDLAALPGTGLAEPKRALGHKFAGCEAMESSGRLEDFYTSDCAYGCGCWMGGTRSGGPEGVDAFGDCPKHPDRAEAKP